MRLNMENKRKGEKLKQSKAGVAGIKLRKTRRRVCALRKRRILEERKDPSDKCAVVEVR